MSKNLRPLPTDFGQQVVLGPLVLPGDGLTIGPIQHTDDDSECWCLACRQKRFRASLLRATQRAAREEWRVRGNVFTPDPEHWVDLMMRFLADGEKDDAQAESPRVAPEVSEPVG